VSTGAASLLAVALVLFLASGQGASSAVAQTQGLDAAPRFTHLAEEGPATREEDKSLDLHINYGALSPEEKEYMADKVKFAEEHPVEAERIHLKFKAMRQAALREEYKHKREEMLERLSETNRARNVVIAILATIVVITVLIDLCASWASEHSDDFSKPVVEILFKELTVLGCIALLVFMSVKTGIPEEISTQIFGTPSELVEMFDMAHVLIFLIVVLFVGMIAIILYRFSFFCKEWDDYEVTAMECVKQGKSLKDIQSLSFGTKPPRPLPEEIKNYCTMRHWFLNPTVRVSRHALDSSFRFSHYLRVCTTHTFKEIVEVEPETWGMVMVFIVLARLFMMIPHEDVKLAVFLSLGVVLLGVMIVTRNKLLEIYMTLVRPNENDSEDNLPYYQQRHREMVRMSKGESKEKTWFHKMCNGEREPNAHEALFWCGAAGPELVLHIIRTCSFLAAVYFAIMVFRFGGDLTRGIHDVVLMMLAVVCPGIMMYHYVPQVIKLYIMTTSIEMLRRKHIIHEVEHEIRRHRRFFVHRLVHTLKGYARRILKADTSARASRDLETARMQEIKEVFDMFEVDCPQRPGTRYIPMHDVENFFIQVGLQMDEGELKDLVQELGDGLDGILFDPTVDFLGGFTSSQLTDQMIDAVFVDIDRDNKNPHKKFDNEITEDEFCAKLAQINPFFGTRKDRGGGAEQLIDWLDWAVVTHNINVASKTEDLDGAEGAEAHVTRVFTPQTFRALLKHGSNV
jgi:Ca2+-binding EF-hand superfamily protein